MSAARVKRDWTDQEQAILEDYSLTHRQVADLTGRSYGAVCVRRGRIRRGEPVGESSRDWTEDEDAVILDCPNMTAAQIASRLPGRSPDAVKRRRREIGANVGDYATRNKHPHRMGARTLVARTCLGCGELLDASMFARTATSQWTRRCSRCRYEASPLFENPGMLRGVMSHWQDVTSDAAHRHGEEWTEDELAALADRSARVPEIALRLGRTYSATLSARRNAGLGDRRKSKDDLQWTIQRADA